MFESWFNMKLFIWSKIPCLRTCKVFFYVHETSPLRLHYLLEELVCCKILLLLGQIRWQPKLAGDPYNLNSLIDHRVPSTHDLIIVVKLDGFLRSGNQISVRVGIHFGWFHAEWSLSSKISCPFTEAVARFTVRNKASMSYNLACSLGSLTTRPLNLKFSLLPSSWYHRACFRNVEDAMLIRIPLFM